MKTNGTTPNFQAWKINIVAVWYPSYAADVINLYVNVQDCIITRCFLNAESTKFPHDLQPYVLTDSNIAPVAYHGYQTESIFIIQVVC